MTDKPESDSPEDEMESAQASEGDGAAGRDGRRIVLGVSGGIAAYKALDLTSALVKGGHEVHVVLTADAQKFVTPLPFQTLSRRPVVLDLYDQEEGWRPVHIRLADEADLLVIAPSTAASLARLAHVL
jgi:phosphopantothenoylcysteine synthetase/decarboxylase